MTIQQLIDLQLFTVISTGHSDRNISSVFCCDLLSIAMGKAPANCAWITVMGNRNTLAVASLADVSCIILAEGVLFGDAEIACAQKEHITVLQTELPVFDAALLVHEQLRQ